MSAPQHWNTCDEAIKEEINGFVRLLREEIQTSLTGVYLHGSLAMGSFYPPKSDIDLIAVCDRFFYPSQLRRLNEEIARYAERGLLAGGLEFSLIDMQTAKAPSSAPEYLLHYSPVWHDRIVKGEVFYTDHMTDIDLFAHLMVIRQRGVCLYGRQIAEIFGSVRWEDFLFAVTEDLKWILAQENICQNPYYGILNICRVLQLLTSRDRRCLSKDEGGQWGLLQLPTTWHHLIQKALEEYHSEATKKNCSADGWDRQELLRFRDYARSEYLRYAHKTGRSVNH